MQERVSLSECEYNRIIQQERCAMHDIIGGSGMLRGWITMWTMQLLWLLAATVVTVGAAAVVELALSSRDREE